MAESVFRDVPSRVAQAVQPRVAPLVRGRVTSFSSGSVRGVLPSARLGDACELRPTGGFAPVPAQVVAFGDGDVVLSPLAEMTGVSSDTEIVPLGGEGLQIAAGEWLRGSVLDGLGRPLAGGGRAPDGGEAWPVRAMPPDALDRPPVRDPMATGVKALDAFATLGVGQRVGVFAAAGVGKSTLLRMLAANGDCDVCVVALIGERGREVREFLELALPPEVRERTVVIVATAEQPALQRVHAAHVATAVAEYFRAQGQHAMLLMDSVTRVARALREIGLAAGEPPTRRGFPASVFAELPRFLERSGASATGAITAVYTVLVEGDDMNEPVADEVRSLVDGHLVLSREMADEGQYPAIDVLASRSRVMENVVDRAHLQAATDARQVLARYKELELLVQMGEYTPGQDAASDRALKLRPIIMELLRQAPDDPTELETTVQTLKAALGDG